MASCKIVLVYLFIINVAHAALKLDPQFPAFDPNFYKEVLDTTKCAKHLDYILKNAALRFKFIDTGIKIPKSITAGNMVDYGSYHECLDIKEKIQNDQIEGKYCMIKVPLKQDLQIPDISLPEWPWPWPNITDINNEDLNNLHQIEERLENNKIIFGGTSRSRSQIRSGGLNIDLSSFSMKVAMCLPKTCTTKEALNSIYFNLSAIGFEFEDEYCRLPNDKPWAPVDTVAICVLSVIGIVTVLSTSYDLYHNLIQKRNPKEANVYLKAFSVYTNTKRLLTFNPVPGAIECIDGIRAFAMAWVILGHTFHAVSSGGNITNLLDVASWTTSAKSLWVMSAPITVDTFFTLSGLLVVYTTAGKFTSLKLLKNLHLFYLNRFLRLFPVLAITVLLQASIFHRVADGPNWNSVAKQVDDCRTYWWTNFLYIQTYTNTFGLCLPQTWYLTVDFHLHVLSPIVLVWVLTSRRWKAWVGLTAGLAISLTLTTVYVFKQQFSTLYTKDPVQSSKFIRDYYMNTLTRAPPFFVGMVFGYMMNLRRDKKIRISKLVLTALWLCAAAVAATVIYTYYYQANVLDYKQIDANLINAFTRAAWAVVISWMILACAQGYGGLINWVLCLQQLKLLSRISYAMYIIHYPIIYVYVGSAVTPFYFEVLSITYTFLSHFAATFACAFILTLLVDSPAMIFIKLMVNGGSKKSAVQAHE